MSRTRTQSEAKWLANEAAVLAGELARIDADLAKLTQQRKVIAEKRQGLLRALELAGARDLAGVLPKVQGHLRYERRGALRQFLRDALRRAAPEALDTQTLMKLVLDNFGLSFPSPAALSDFRHNSLGRALRWIEQQGLIEGLREDKAPGVAAVGMNTAARAYRAWRWRTDVVTVEQLAEVARSAS